MEKSSIRTPLKVLSIIFIVLGGLAVIGSVINITNPDAGYGIIGGSLFIGQGWLALSYIGERNKS